MNGKIKLIKWEEIICVIIAKGITQKIYFKEKNYPKLSSTITLNKEDYANKSSTGLSN
jgi:hypothetical protein